MVELPYVAEPPDLIRVEVLEALPGRPIKGERLIRPDGMISLGFYGDIYVRGLTLPQIKHKLVVHLGKFLPDEKVGLRAQDAEGKWQDVQPRDSDKVLVDVSTSPSKTCYIQGEVDSPGKLPWTANETVLDALIHAKGLLKKADPKDIRLVRPGRDGKPARLYKLDYEAILDRGEIEENYQLFPGDRLIVGRSAVGFQRDAPGLVRGDPSRPQEQPVDEDGRAHRQIGSARVDSVIFSTRDEECPHPGSWLAGPHGGSRR